MSHCFTPSSTVKGTWLASYYYTPLIPCTRIIPCFLYAMYAFCNAVTPQPVRRCGALWATFITSNKKSPYTTQKPLCYGGFQGAVKALFSFAYAGLSKLALRAAWAHKRA